MNSHLTVIVRNYSWGVEMSSVIQLSPLLSSVFSSLYTEFPCRRSRRTPTCPSTRSSSMSSTMQKRGLTWLKRRSTSSGFAPATKLARWDNWLHVAFHIPLCCWIVTFGYIYQTQQAGIITRTNFRESVCNPLLNLSHVISAVVTSNSDTVYVVANKHAAVCFSLPNDVPRPNISQLASCKSCASLWERSQINF